MARIAEAATYYQGTKCGFGEEAGAKVIRKSRLQRKTIHFREFVVADGIDFFAKERWQREEVM
jgi:hypothetical protein